MDYSKKAIIFDLDGVLVDSAICHFKAWKMIADQLGLSFDERNNDRLRGVSRRESLLLMLDGRVDLSEEKMAELMEEKNEVYKKLVDESGDALLLPGVKPFLKELKEKGFKLAVASSSKNTPSLMKQAGLDDGFFDAVAHGGHITNTKPDPEVFLLAAEQVGISPADCLVVEDALAGVEGAKAATMGVWGVGPAELGTCDIRTDSIEETDLAQILKFFKERG